MIDHLSIMVSDFAKSRAFYQQALAPTGHSGTSASSPAHHPNYYGAYVLDPDGHNIEAVCHEAQ
jgi:catechol 2,3-dioxygenase-like lactoylglutathione lyase family enzyme